MALQIRRTLTILDETRSVVDRSDGRPLRKVAALAVVENPLAGRGYVSDLGPLVDGSAELGALLGAAAAAALGGPVQSYGKAAMVGTGGEQEHANACLTSTFGDAFRAAIGGGRAWISSVTKRAGCGSGIDVPLAFKDEIWVRSHYDSIEVSAPGAPAPDEIVVIAAVADRGRINARLGGMDVDEVEP